MGKNSHIVDKRRADNHDPQLKSIQSRTRSHLIYECKRSILTIYGLQSLPPVELAAAVEKLLHLDRFTCQIEKREASTSADIPCRRGALLTSKIGT